VREILACSAVFIALGCGGSSSDFDSSVLVPVKGRVMIDGQPASGVSIIFHPRQQTAGTGGYAVTDKNGDYMVDHRSGVSGVEPGEYAVTFSRYTQPDGSPIPAGASAADVGAVESLPKLYTDATNPKLPTQISVPVNGGEFPFEISTTRQSRR